MSTLLPCGSKAIASVSFLFYLRKSLSLLSSICLLTLAATPLQAAEPFRAGAASTIITPDPLLPVSGGMGPTQPATKKLGELSTRAVVISKGKTTVAIVSVDALGFPSVLVQRVAKKIPFIPLENIIVGSTHTHSAPDFYAFPDGQGGHTGDLVYIDQVCNKMAETIVAAHRNMKECSLRVATGDVEGQVAYNYYAVELFDPRASILQFIDNDKKTIATLVNYAIHPEVLGNEVGAISPDLIGPLYDRIESKVGGVALFINGAQGGMITADNRDLSKIADPLKARWIDKRIWSECERIGTTLADESLRIIDSAKPIPNAELLCQHRNVDFPVDSDALWGVVQYSPLRYPHNDNRTVTSRINILQIGPARIATIPGEALPNIGFYLKRKMHGEHNLLFGLTNDAFGYILTEVDFASFARYDYVSRVSLGEQTGTILIRNILELDQQISVPAEDKTTKN